MVMTDPGLPAMPHMSQVGNVAGISQEEWATTIAARVGPRTKIGAFEQVHVFWLAGMSCDGCSIAVLGATAPSVESLMTGALPGVPIVFLHHTAVQLESGDAYMEPMRKAWRGELDAPYVVVYEGSLADESLAGTGGGYWSTIGEEGDGPIAGRRQIPSAEWAKRLAPGAAATIAIGTCATWGGVPAAFGNVTGAMSLTDFLGADYRSALGLPIVNIPGCSPIGDNFTETVTAILLFLQGVGPLPEFDDLGRPAWLFGETVHQGCTRAGYYEEGTFAQEYGDKECLVELGCWGPVVNCNINSRGAINHVGGCMNVGGICIGCTMPGFPDKFAPFYKAPPGMLGSSTASKLVGSFVRPLRRMTQRDLNREVRWDHDTSGKPPTGWGSSPQPTFVDRLMHVAYERMRHSDTAAKDR